MKRLFLFLFPFVFTTVAALATPDVSRGQRGPTPYDPYLQPVQSVLRGLHGTPPSFQQVSAWVRQGRSFDYVFDSPYVPATPEVTAARHAGDCKAKSLWLANRMKDPSVRFVIGKARNTSKISHMWLMWRAEGKWWILDPTNESRPIAANSVGPNEYLVLYAYDRSGSYSYSSAPTRSRRSVAGHN